MDALWTQEFIKWVIQNFIGVAFGGFIFWFYRKDILRKQDECKQREAYLSQIAERATSVMAEVQNTLREVRETLKEVQRTIRDFSPRA